MNANAAPTAGVTRLEISLDTLAANYQRLVAAVRPAAVMAVLKDNAYGHGLTRVAQELLAAGCRRFACATLGEALQLRRHCPGDYDLLILRALTDSELPVAIRSGCQITVNDMRTLQLADQLAGAAGIRLPVHLKVDTGLGRLGFLPDEVPAALAALRQAPQLIFTGIYSHLAMSWRRHEFSENQINLFRQALAQARAVQPDIIGHMTATAGTLTMPDARFAMVRISSLLYGLSYLNEWPWGLEPVLRWVAPLIQARSFPEGWNIGYKLLYRTRPGQRIGVLAVGAGDSYPYALRLKGHVLLRGRRCPVVGMSLDQTMIDLTPAPAAQAGEEAVLIGRDGDDEIRAEELGATAETSYGEILARIPARLPRCYFRAGRMVAADGFGLPEA